MPKSYRVYRRHRTPSVETRVDCSVCGFPGIDPDRTAEPETTPTTYTQVKDTDLGDPEDVYEATVPPYSACPLCGSPRWRDGRPGDLKRVP